MDSGTQSEPKRLAQWGRVILRVLGYIVRLPWEAFRYLGRTCLDLFFAIRFLLLWREQRRSPTRSWEFNSKISSLVERRAKRWAEWYTLSGRQCLEIRLVALLIVVAIVFGLRSYITRSEDVAVTVSSQGQTIHPESHKTAKELTEERKAVSLGDESETLSPQSQTERTDSKKIAKGFAERIKAASTGQWLFYKRNPVLVRGELNQWDDFKVGSPVVIKEGGRYRMWYRGCHFIGSDYTCGIGHAVSQDGILWEKSSKPVLVIEDTARSKLLDTVVVLRVAEERYMMWYSLSSDWFAGRHYATIYLATSKDGLNWRQEGAVLRAVRKGTTIAPSAFYDGEVFHLWYVDSTSTDKPKALMHVTSSDGRRWQVAGWTFINTLDVDPGRMWVLSDGRGGYRGFYAHPSNQQEKKGFFGTVVSADGNTWEMSEGMNAVAASLEKGVIADAPAVLLEPHGLWVWFVLRPEDGAETINAAYRKGELP